MFRVWAIAQREFAAMIATKAFLITLVMMPILMLGGLVLLPTLTKLGGVKNRKIVVVDGTGTLFETIRRAAEQQNAMIDAAANPSSDSPDKEKGDGNKNPFEAAEIWDFQAAPEQELDDKLRMSLSDQIREGSLYAFVEIPAQWNDLSQPSPLPIRFVSQDSALSGARRWLENVISGELRGRRLTLLGIDPQLVSEANVPLSVEPTMPYTSSDDGTLESKEGADMLVTMFLPFGIMMLMFLVIFLAAQPMLESGMEEKNARIAELLLGSVSPRELMTGKLLGNVAGSFVIFAFYGTGGWFAMQHNDWAVHLPWSLMPWLIVFQILGVLFYSSIFLTIGASVSELKEAQSLLMPVWMMMMIPMMVWFIAVRDPNGVLSVSLSLFPPTTSMMMSLRMSAGQAIPIWQPTLAAILLLAATIAVVMIAARIYRASLLKTDSAKSIAQLFKRLQAAE